MKQCILKPSLAYVAVALCFLTSVRAIALAQENHPAEKDELRMSPAEAEQARAFLKRDDVQRILRLAHQTDTSRAFQVEDLPIINRVTTESTELFKRGRHPSVFSEQDLMLIGVACIEARDSNAEFKSKMEEPAYENVRKLVAMTEIMVLALQKLKESESESAKSANEQSSSPYGGIGTLLAKNEQTDEIIIQKCMEESPARRAGLRKNDVVIAIDDLSVSGKKLDDVIAQVRGKVGTSVKVTIRRNGGPPEKIRIERTLIQVAATPSP